MGQIISILRSCLFYAAFYCGTGLFVLIGLIAMAVAPKSTSTISVLWSAYHRWCVRYILNITINIIGHMPVGPVLVAYKHESFFEAIDVLNLVKRPGVFAKAELLRIPFWGKIGQYVGLIGVERDQGAKALRTMLSAAKKYIREERSLVIFPEGTRAKHGSRPALQSGFAGIYKLLALDVVPIAINSGVVFRHRWKKPGTITIAIGATIPAGLSREEIEERVHSAINSLNSSADGIAE